MRNVISSVRYCLVILAGLSFLFLSGCGPTRKEYAINEALLVDQTRMLEDQLYRSHFQIQHLLDENARLKERLGEPDEEQEESPVPFNAEEQPKENPERRRPYYPPINPSDMPNYEQPSDVPQAADGTVPLTNYRSAAGKPQRVAARPSVSNRGMSGKQNYRVGTNRR